MRTWLVAGDVVESRRFVDRDALLAGLDACLARVNEAVAPVRALARTADDEFFGACASQADVLRAVVRLRIVTDDLVLATRDGEDEPVDVRVGIARVQGAGVADHAPVATDEADPWAPAIAARSAAQQLPARPTWPPSMRTAVHGDAAESRLLQAHLIVQDQLLARMDARDRRALLGLLAGERQVDIAAALGVTQPAVAKRVRDRGALAIMRSVRVLADLEP